MQIAPHPFLQFARLGHILSRCHTGTLFLFLQIVIWRHRFCKHLPSGRWNGNLQFWSGSVLMRSHHWTLVTWWADWAGMLVPGREVKGHVRDALGVRGGVHRFNGPRMIYRAPEVIWWIWWSEAACPRGSRGCSQMGQICELRRLRQIREEQSRWGETREISSNNLLSLKSKRDHDFIKARLFKRPNFETQSDIQICNIDQTIVQTSSAT